MKTCPLLIFCLLFLDNVDQESQKAHSLEWRLETDSLRFSRHPRALQSLQSAPTPTASLLFLVEKGIQCPSAILKEEFERDLLIAEHRLGMELILQHVAGVFVGLAQPLLQPPFLIAAEGGTLDLPLREEANGAVGES